MSVLSVTGSVLVSLDDDTTDFAPYMGLDHRMALARGPMVVPLELDTDSAVVVDLNGLSIHALVALSNRKVKMTMTSTDGTAQSVPCDPIAFLVSESVPITALSFTRVAGQATSVKLLLAQKS